MKKIMSKFVEVIKFVVIKTDKKILATNTNLKLIQNLIFLNTPKFLNTDYSFTNKKKRKNKANKNKCRRGNGKLK